MRIAAVIVIVAALGVAGLTFFLAKGLLDDQSQATQEQEAAAAVPSVQVVVATRDLPAGTILQEGDTRWQPWPEQSLDPDYVVQAQGQGGAQIHDLNGTVVRRAISTGEPVTFRRVFTRGEAGFLSGVLTPGMRAVSINVNPASGASGFVLPGDRVDLILMQGGIPPIEDTDGPQISRASETILRDLRVLAVDQIINDVEGVAKIVKTVTLEVTPKEAEIIAVSSMMGTMQLSLRSLTPGTDDPTLGNFTADLDVSLALGGGLDGNDPRRGGGRGGAVIVYRITQEEKVKVGR